MIGITKKIAAVILIGLFILPEVSFSQGKAIRIKDIQVKNNSAVSEATILSKVKTRPGDLFRQDVLNDDLKRLYALGYFTDVSIDIEEESDGIVVTIIVEEKPVVLAVIFEGNAKISSRKLKKGMQIKTGDVLNYSKLSQDINEFKSMYNQSGFQQVVIRYEIETEKETNEATIYVIVDEKSRIRVKKVYVEGNLNVEDKEILSMMSTRPAWLLNRGYFNEEKFDSDIEKISRYYQNRGFLDVKIAADFEYDDEKGLMYITLKVDEGKQYMTGDVILEGNLVFPEEVIMNELKIRPGDPFSHSKLRGNINILRGFYFKKGYMNVEITVDRKLDPETNIINVFFKVNANEVVYVGKVNIKGNTKTKDIVVRRELRIYPGEKFNGDKIRRSKERLYNLGFFEDIYLSTEATSDPDVKDLVVGVKETKTGEFAFGGGYSSVDAFLGFVQITQKNFDLFNWPNFTGDGQQLAVKASIGSVRMDYELSWTEPWIFDYPVSLGFDLYNRTHSRSSSVGYGYKETRTGGDWRLGKEFTEEIRMDGMYKLEEVNITDLSGDATQDLVSERGANWVSTLLMALTYDTRDNIYTPKKGVYSKIICQNSGGFLGFDKDFLKGFWVTSYYHSFFDNRVVVEVKGRTGIANSYLDTDEVPLYERFYAGGAYTIRGYGERRVGPRDPGSNDPIGGEAMVVGNVEITFPLIDKLIKGAVFYDVGNVWRRAEDYFQGGFKHGIGLGIRVKTPIGPLKLDFGYPLSDNRDDKKRIEPYFSVSHGF